MNHNNLTQNSYQSTGLVSLKRLLAQSKSYRPLACGQVLCTAMDQRLVGIFPKLGCWLEVQLYYQLISVTWVVIIYTKILGGGITHPEGLIQEKNKENLRKIGRK